MHYAYQLRLEKLVDRFSLTSVELSVGEFLDQGDTTVRGISLYGLGFAPTGIFEHVALPSREGVSQLISFIGNVLRNDLPAKLCIDAGHRKKLRWGIRKFTSEWHEGGAYFGWIYLAHLPLGVLQPNYSGITVTPKTLDRLAVCLESFYEIAV